MIVLSSSTSPAHVHDINMFSYITRPGPLFLQTYLQYIIIGAFPSTIISAGIVMHHYYWGYQSVLLEYWLGPLLMGCWLGPLLMGYWPGPLLMGYWLRPLLLGTLAWTIIIGSIGFNHYYWEYWPGPLLMEYWPGPLLMEY